MALRHIIGFFAALPLHMLPYWPFVLAYVIFYTNYWYLGLAYVTWMIYDRDTPNQGGKEISWNRSTFAWKQFVKYYSLKLVKTAELDGSKNYLLCAHPHGVFAQGVIGNFSCDLTGVKDLFPGLRTQVLTVQGHFHVPVERDILLYTIGTSSSSEKNIKHILRNTGGNAPVLCVGGVHEVLNAHPGDYVISLTKRRGFVRIALETGTPLVPCFTFGENDVFDHVSNPPGSRIRRCQEFLIKHTGIPFLILKHLVPKPIPLTTVVGSPISCEKVPHPTNSQIDVVHAQFVSALQSLFYKYRDAYGESNRNLKIV